VAITAAAAFQQSWRSLSITISIDLQEYTQLCTSGLLTLGVSLAGYIVQCLHTWWQASASTSKSPWAAAPLICDHIKGGAASLVAESFWVNRYTDSDHPRRWRHVPACMEASYLLSFFTTYKHTNTWSIDGQHRSLSRSFNRF